MLLLLMILPFIFSIICLISEKIYISLPKWVSIICINITFLLFINISINIKNNLYKFITSWNLQFRQPWIPQFGINIILSLDKLSWIMILLTIFSTLLSILYSWNTENSKPGFFYSSILWLFGGLIGIFLATDMFLFFIFWEIIILPIYFLVVFYGNREHRINLRIKRANKILIYSQISGLFLLISTLHLVIAYYKKYKIFTFDYDQLTNCLAFDIELIIMLCLFLAFAIKMPLVPFHTWLPDIQSSSPISGSLDLSILTKISIYGIIRFMIPIYPHIYKDFSYVIAILSLINIFYGSWIAFSQSDIKKIIAYSNVYHIGFILFGIYSGNKLAFNGIIIHIIMNVMSNAGMLIINKYLNSILKTNNINLMGGLWHKIKFLPGISLFFILSIIGLPGSGNFISEIIILLGCFDNFPIITTISSLGLLFSLIYNIFLFNKIYYGNSNIKIIIKPIKKVHIFTILFIILIILTIGIYPKIIIQNIKIIVNNIHRLI